MEPAFLDHNLSLFKSPDSNSTFGGNDAEWNAFTLKHDHEFRRFVLRPSGGGCGIPGLVGRTDPFQGCGELFGS